MSFGARFFHILFILCARTIAQPMWNAMHMSMVAARLLRACDDFIFYTYLFIIVADAVDAYFFSACAPFCVNFLVSLWSLHSSLRNGISSVWNAMKTNTNSNNNWIAIFVNMCMSYAHIWWNHFSRNAVTLDAIDSHLNWCYAYMARQNQYHLYFYVQPFFSFATSIRSEFEQKKNIFFYSISHIIFLVDASCSDKKELHKFYTLLLCEQMFSSCKNKSA